MSFTLCTSGEVPLTAAQGIPYEIAGGHRWDDLSPFVQGYIEAALRGAGVERYDALAPETLARIIADCEANRRGSNRMPMATAGREFWTIRQAGSLPKFPPLTVQLSDDGRIYFKELTQ